MRLLTFFFPRRAARLARVERLAGRLAELAGYDEWADPLLAGVVEQVRAGRRIKAAKLYCQATGCGVDEAMIAVSELRARMAEPKH